MFVPNERSQYYRDIFSPFPTLPQGVAMDLFSNAKCQENTILGERNHLKLENVYSHCQGNMINMRLSS